MRLRVLGDIQKIDAGDEVGIHVVAISVERESGETCNDGVNPADLRRLGAIEERCAGRMIGLSYRGVGRSGAAEGVLSFDTDEEASALVMYLEADSVLGERIRRKGRSRVEQMYSCTRAPDMVDYPE